MPSLFSVSHPVTVFQLWFVIYLYLLPFMLYAAWGALALIELGEHPGGPSRRALQALVLLVPVLGSALYLLLGASAAQRRSRLLIVLTGLVAWGVPLAAGIWLAGGPLGPKALS